MVHIKLALYCIRALWDYVPLSGRADLQHNSHVTDQHIKATKRVHTGGVELRLERLPNSCKSRVPDSKLVAGWMATLHMSIPQFLYSIVTRDRWGDTHTSKRGDAAWVILVLRKTGWPVTKNWRQHTFVGVLPVRSVRDPLLRRDTARARCAALLGLSLVCWKCQPLLVAFSCASLPTASPTQRPFI